MSAFHFCMVCHAAFASARLPLKCLGLVRNHTGGYNVSADHDLAIRWNDDISSVRHLRHTGSVPIWAFPRSFRCPGGVVAIISQNNDIRLMFRATAIHGPQRVKLANGKSRLNGDVIKFDKRAMREPRPLIRAPFRRWYAVGAFRYFNAAKMRPILVGDSVRFSVTTSRISWANPPASSFVLIWRAFRGCLVGIRKRRL